MPKVIDQEKIFNAAIDVLVTHGYESATTKKIAAAAGMHEATLFRKFGTKLRLIEQAIEQQISTAPLNKLQFTGDLEVDLLSIVGAYMDTDQQFGELIPILLAEVPRNPELKQSTLKLWVNIKLILDILQRYQERGMLKKEPVLNSVNVLIGPLMVSQMFRRANLGLPVPAIDPQEHVATFLHGRKQ